MWLLILISGLGLALGQDKRVFECDFLPSDQRATRQPHGPFRVSLSEKMTWTPDSLIVVTLENTNPEPLKQVSFNQFILQAHDVADHTVGRWILSYATSNQSLYDCPNPEDTVVNNGDEPVTKIRAVFNTPLEAEFVESDIDFNAAVYSSDGKYWDNIRSVLLKKKVDTSAQLQMDKNTEITNDAHNDNELAARLPVARKSANSSFSQEQRDHDFIEELKLKENGEIQRQEMFAQEEGSLLERQNELQAEEQKSLNKINQEIIEYNERHQAWELKTKEMMEFEQKDKHFYEEEMRQIKKFGISSADQLTPLIIGILLRLVVFLL